MNELQIILIVCAVVFVGSLYWWGKKSKNEPIQRAYRSEPLAAETPEDEGFEVREVVRAKLNSGDATDSSRDIASTQSVSDELPIMKTSHSAQLQASLFAESVNEAQSTVMENLPSNTSLADDDALAARMSESTQEQASSSQSDQSNALEPPQTQLFALLVLSASAKFKRKQLHVAMEASRLTFHQDGTYVKQDANGNIIFRIANVVEPGYFTAIDDADFESPGVALVLEFPNAISAYRAMDEFITVARKVSQNLGAKLYDAQRHLIKESDLKAMREYAQSITF
jgi:cell division protein ZipA